MSNEVATRPDGGIMERVLLAGDLARLQPGDRVKYYNAVCESVGLNPLTRPFEYISLNGKLTLYARKDATEQLRKLNGISVEKLEREITEGIYVVTSYGRDKTNRTDSSIGAVPIKDLAGEALANAMMKAETKSKRRLTLSISGLGWLDETEVDSIPNAHRMDAATVEATPVTKVALPPPAAATATTPPAETKRGPGRPKAPVRMVDVPPAAGSPTDLAGAAKVAGAELDRMASQPIGQADIPWPDDAKPREPEVVQEPGVSQPTPPEEVQHTPVDQVDVKGPESGPITRPTQQAVFRIVGELNKSKGPGTAQGVMGALHPDARPINRYTEIEALELVKCFQHALTLDPAAIKTYVESLGKGQ